MYYLDENQDDSISYDEFKVVFDPIMKGPLTLLSDRKVKTLNYEQRQR